MAKQETPGKKDENPFVTEEGKLNTDLVAKFQDALKETEQDAYKTLGLDAPKPTDTPPKETKSDDEIQKLKDMATFALSELDKNGVKLNPDETTSKMSEFEKTFNDKLEKIAVSKLSEAKKSILELNKDFPVEKIDELDIPTEAKIQVAATIQDITTQHQSAISKLSKELDTQKTSLEELQSKVPQETNTETKTGEARVKDQFAKFGLDSTQYGIGQKEVNPADQLAEAISKLAAQGTKGKGD